MNAAWQHPLRVSSGIFFLLLGFSLAAHAGWNSQELAEKALFQQKLGAQAPLNLAFHDETGRAVRLSDYFGKKPVLLNLVYYRCPSLCTEVLNGLVRAIRVPKMLSVGNDFQIVTLSIDSREKPALAQKKADLYRTKYGRPVPAGAWPFLTGAEKDVQALAQSVGFGFAYDSQLDQYAHSSGLVVLTPQGKVSRYLYGVEYSPRDLRLALTEASSGKIGGPVEQVLLYCYQYDPINGRYGLSIMRVLRASAAACVLALGAFVIIMIRRERYA